MTEENVNKLIEAIKEKAYVPNDWVGVSNIKTVRLEDVLNLIEQLRDKKPNNYWW